VLYQAVLERGSEVVVPVPAWPTFAEAARVAGAVPVLVELQREDGFRLSARTVARALGPRTRAVVVNSPSNPTGAVVEPAELLKIAHLARNRGFWLVYDDTYAHLVFREEARCALRELRSEAGGNLAVVGTASKSYCMTGWRIGWLAGPRALSDACAALNSHSVQGPATFAQLAAVAALTATQEPLRALNAEYRRRRDLVQASLAGIPGVACPEPAGGFYVFPDVRRCLSRQLPDTVALCTRLLEQRAVALVPGEGFHAPGHFRLSFAAAPADLREGTRRLAEFLAEVAAAPRPRAGGR
jgi:aspartate aminotransferase